VRIVGNSTAYAPVTIRSVGTADAPVTFSAAATGDGSLVNLTAGRTRPVLAVVPVGADSSIRIHNALGSVDVVADLEGYYG
jgi:hypothetical protein